ncbi:CrcB family protein [Corynebacterium sp. TAE3-ERU12]|nr:CrcB family protein [Corynebacterium sp. TAE3-ERU12]
MTLVELLLTAAGGATGALSRAVFLSDSAWSLVIINIVGCAVMGLTTEYFAGTKAWFFIGPGFLGGFTSFSTFVVLADANIAAAVATIIACPAAYLVTHAWADER